MTHPKVTLEMLSPIPEYLDTKDKAIPLAVRPETLDGLTLGLLPNWRPSASAVLDAVGGLLQERFHIKDTTVRQPMRELPFGASGLIAPLMEALDDLAAHADVVVTATGD